MDTIQKSIDSLNAKGREKIEKEIEEITGLLSSIPKRQVEEESDEEDAEAESPIGSSTVKAEKSSDHGSAVATTSEAAATSESPRRLSPNEVSAEESDQSSDHGSAVATTSEAAATSDSFL